MDLHLPWWNRLGVRLAAVIGCVSIATITVLLALTLRSQERHLLAQALQSAAIVSDTISSSIQFDMLHDRRAEAYEIMGTVAGQPQVERLRIMDAAGRIRYSMDGAEIGQTPDLKGDACRPCHEGAPPQLPLSSGDRTRVAERDGRRVLAAITPIYNRPACSTASCHVHPPAQRIVGVLELGLGLDMVDRETAVLRRSTVALSMLAIAVLGVVTFAFTHRLVVQPVTQLVEETRRVKLGEVDRGVTVRGATELGVLESSFNEMERAIAVARAERDGVLETLERQVAERSAALEKAQERLIQTEKLSSLGKLSASIAHEINNPLSGILTTAKLLLRTLEDGPLTDTGRSSVVRQLQLVQRETERCTAIVRNLLGFARERPLTISDADIRAALEEALFLIANQIALQNVTLERDLRPIPILQGDFGQLRQAFANILINACDAMPRGGTLRVSCVHVLPADVVEVRIEDTGVGIPREQLSKVLDPFFTTKEKGTGLGLSVVFGVVERHGGRLAIDSEIGVGTAVTIQLPVCHAVAATAPASTTAGAARGEGAAGAAP
jgi:two-component system NtrC family sensor kinase